VGKKDVPQGLKADVFSIVVRTGMSVTEGTGHVGNTFRQS
jgi:hypothetical protein